MCWMRHWVSSVNFTIEGLWKSAAGSVSDGGMGAVMAVCRSDSEALMRSSLVAMCMVSS
jgi:hypothetical protein